MSKVNRVVVLIIVLFMVLLLIMFLCRPEKKKIKEDGRILVSEIEAGESIEDPSFRMNRINENSFVIRKIDNYYAIYRIINRDGNIEERLFDYTFLNDENMEREVRESLEDGMHFRDEYDLYAFLQAYTS